jgi:hypothetical protein
MSMTYLPRALWYWIYSNGHMIKQTLNVLDFMWLHRVNAGLLPADHPWLTGSMPGSGETIWSANRVPTNRS